VTRRPLHRAAVRIVLLAAAASLVASAIPTASARAAEDRLPDLKSARTRDFRIVKTGSGRRLLRFASMLYNRGAGPFEIRTSRPNTATAWDVDQIVYDDEGGARRIQTAARLRFAGDGHDHWHVRRMMSYHLWGSGGTFRDAKIGFCFFDTNLVDAALPRSPARAVYRQSTCGRRSSLHTSSGVSVGWGDRYPWNFAYQWIDITGLRGGTYTLRSAVDLDDLFEESSETNNCEWTRIRFGSTGTTVRVIERGTQCIDDWSATGYASHIQWALDEGVMRLCDTDLFCTNTRVSRARMAVFFVRVMDLPPAGRDYFDDDDGSTHEWAINRIAEAGLLRGCGVRRFCGSRLVTRAVMAMMLYRALDLPSADRDYFDDDDGTIYERSINALAAAGLTFGCGDGGYCPSAPVTNGQTAAYLHRGFGAPD
jgi:Lysyl oxidase/S-layer homology domain